MVVFTNEQVAVIMARLDRAQEIFDSMADKAVREIENIADEKRSLEREVERLKNRLKSTEEELAMAQKALANSLEIIDGKNRQVERLAATINGYADESERLRQVAHQNAVSADGFSCEVMRLRDILGMLRVNLKVSGSDWTPWHAEVALGYIDFALND